MRANVPGPIRNWLSSATAAWEMSVAITRAACVSVATAHAIAPLPVHGSMAMPPAGTRATASPASTSVSGLGMNTPGLTVTSR